MTPQLQGDPGGPQLGAAANFPSLENAVLELRG